MSGFLAPARRARWVALVVASVALAVVALAGCYPIADSPYNQYMLFDGVEPATKAANDTQSVELGVRFKPASSGSVLGVRFYKGTGNTGTHTGTLWSNTGSKLATVTFTGETASGWQTAEFASPVAVTAGTTYVVSYHAPVGRYAYSSGWFASPYVHGPLTAPATSGSSPTSVYRYGSTTAFPTGVNSGANYFVDVVFTDGTLLGSTPTTKPTTTTAKPTTTTTTAPPPTSGFPTPQTTGWARTGVSLTPYTGPSIITTAGTVIDSKDITTCLTIRAKNVTIKRSRMRCASDFGINQNTNSQGLLVEDVEITSGGGILDRAVLLTDGAILRRIYVHGMQRGISVGNNTTVEDSYVGDNQNQTDAHTSAIGTSGGTHHVIVRRNTLQTLPNTNASSAISFYPELWAGGANDDFLIEGNLLNSGGGYAVYLGHSPASGESPNTNFRFINNRFGTLYYPGCGIYGPVASWSNVSSNTWSGNTWYDQRATTSSYQNKNGQTVNF